MRSLVDSCAADGGGRIENNYACQNFQQVFTAVPVHIKHVFTGVPKFSYKFSSV